MKGHVCACMAHPWLWCLPEATGKCPANAGGAIFPPEWAAMRGALASVLAAQPDAAAKAPYMDAFLQYGDYLLEGVDRLREAGAAGTCGGGGSAAGCTHVQQVEELYEALAIAQLQLNVQSAIFSGLGLDLDEVLCFLNPGA